MQAASDLHSEAACIVVVPVYLVLLGAVVLVGLGAVASGVVVSDIRGTLHKQIDTV